MIDREGIDVDEEDEGAASVPRIMPFEFLYLLTNASPRMERLKNLKAPKFEVQKVPLSEFFDSEERRQDLEQIYPYDIPGNSRRHNPRE